MSSRRKGTSGSKKDVNLLEMVQSGPQGAYEALQLFRSRALRAQTKNDLNAALAAAQEGASCLLENGYENAGAELADLYVSLLVEINRPVNDESRTEVFGIDSKFPEKSAHRIEFLKACVKWTAASGNRELGDPLLHRRLAESLWNNGEYKSSYYHFAAGEAPGILNHMIFETFNGAQQQLQRDQALTTGVVNFLSLENLRDANELFSSYQRSQRDKGVTSASELVTFVEYLLQTCRRDAGPLFKNLVNTYATALDFDDTVPTMLTGPIAFKFFGIKPKVNPMMSMLQSMMS